MAKRQLAPIIALVGGVVLFLLFLMIIGINPTELARRISGASKTLLAVAIIVDTFYILTYALAWFFIVKAIEPHVRLQDIVVIVLIGWFGDMIVPAAFVTGEAIRLFLLKRMYGVEYSRAAATIVVHRLLSAVAFALFVGLGLAFTGGPLVGNGELKHIMFFLVLSIVAVVLGLLLVAKIDRVAAILIRLSEKARKSKVVRLLSRDLETSVKSFVDSVNVLKSNKAMILAGFALLVIQWGLGVAVPYIVFDAVGHHMSYWKLAVAFPIYGLADNVPIGIPVNAGVLDAAMVSMFMLLGAPREVAVSVTLLTRAITVAYEGILTGLVTILVTPRIIGEADTLDRVKGMLWRRQAYNPRAT